MINQRTWSWLYVVCFLDLLGASMIMPVFSSHLRAHGLTHTNIGLLSSIYGISQLISGPVLGSWSDINGRQSILYLSLFICAVAYYILGIISSFYMFVIIRCGLGMFKHTQTLCRAFTADIVPAEDQASVYGLMNAITSFSFMVGPVISGHIMEFENGFQVLTKCVFFTFILNGTIVFLFANSNKSNTRSCSGYIDNITAVFGELYSIKWKSYGLLFSIKFLLSLASIMLFQNIGLGLTDLFQTSPRYIGYTISFYGLVSGLSSVGVSWIKKSFLDNKPAMNCLSLLLSIMAVSLYWLYKVDNYPMFVVGLLPLSCSHALCRTYMTEMVLASSDKSVHGSMMGASSSIAAVARIVAPTVGGLVTTWGGVSAPFLMSSAVAACAGILTVISIFLS